MPTSRHDDDAAADTARSTLLRPALAEALGTGTLTATVVGAGIAATGLTRDAGVQQLMGVLGVFAVLAVLIWSFGSISGAHFNPAVTLVAVARGEMRRRDAGVYLVVQLLGALAGLVVAHLMFGLPAFTVSSTAHRGLGIWLGEVVATAGLIGVIGALVRTGTVRRLGPALIPAWVVAMALFTSSAFANPALTVARALTGTVTGIAPGDVVALVIAQLIGATLGALITEFFFPRDSAA